MPNAFSPNGDGKNDVVKPLLVGYTQLNYFRIFNRWGQQVFATSNTELGWNGAYKNDASPIGTYYWIVSADDINGKEVVKKGDLTLLR
jgi:gliding motility-associated-like protein